jgi:three-Cys-motif partner protein
VLNDDANLVVDQIFGSQPEDTHSFVFIDNEGSNVNWRSIQTILKSESDILINYPTKCFQRTTQDRTAGSLNEFGDSSWRNALVQGEEIDSSKALAIYEEKLRKTFWHSREKAPFVSSIRIGMQNWFYDLILCCKSGKYIKAWDDLKAKTYWRAPNIPRNACNLLRGKSSILDQYITPYDQASSGKKVAELGPKFKPLTDF